MTFIEQVTYDLTQRGWENLRNLTVVFPMHRAALFMKEELKRQMLAQGCDKPVVAPRFTTLSELVDELCAPYLQPDDEIRSVCQLHRIFCEKMHEDLPLDIFYGWGKQLLTDFSNADMSEADALRLFENSADARMLEKLDIDDDTRQRLEYLVGGQKPETEEDGLKKELHALWSTLPEVYEEFNRQQQDLHVAYAGARLKYVVDNFEKIAPQVAGRQFAFVGFNYLLGKERALMEKLKNQSWFYWDHIDGFNTNSDAYKYTAAGIEKFGQALKEQTPQSYNNNKLNIIATSTSGAQAQYVHQWLSKCAKEEGRIGIVIADETMLEPVIYALPKDVSGQVNITKGYPLRNTKVFADIIAYLSDKTHDKSEGETYAAVLRRLSEAIAVTIDNEREQGRENWQQALIQESYYQAQTVLNRFCMLIEDGTLAGITQLSTLRNLLRRHLETVLLPFHGDPVTKIQVIGVLETRLLDFDHLLVLNVEESVLPKTGADNSFIPYYLRKCFHMPTGSESAEVYAHNFFRLLRRCQDTTLLFSDATDGDSKKGMSRFLMQILTSDEFQVTKYRLTESSHVATDDLELTDKHKSLPHVVESLSPSAIKTYLKCKMKYYMQYVLGIREADKPGIILQANEMGTLIHATIQAIYEKLLKSLPAPVEPETLLAVMDDKQSLKDDVLDPAIDDAFVALNEDYQKRNHTTESPFVRAQHKAEVQVVKDHVRKVFKADLKTAQNGCLELVEMETEHTMMLPIPTVGDVKVGGRIDRIDIANEHRRILDYKTGKRDGTEAESMEKLFVPETKCDNMLQAFLYCLVYESPDSLPVMPGLVFTRVADGDPTLKIGKDDKDKENGKKKSKDKEPVTNFAEYSSEFRERLVKLIQEMLTATSFPKNEDDNACGYCPFKLLCNRDTEQYN